jgi:phosphoribosylanthranilate isomerase
MTTIKICGITRQQDASAAVDLGADALGFILFPKSPRATTLAHAAAIVARLPRPVEKVAVFVNPLAQDLIDAKSAGFTVAQVHEHLPENRSGIRVLRAVRLAASGSGIEPGVPGDDPILLDAHDPVLHGGTGRTVDWDRARTIAAARKIFLAGGLTPDNVGEAIRTVRPYAVDVASGVEASPGIKDLGKLQAFIHAVKETV